MTAADRPGSADRSATASIDELLRYDEEPTPRRPARPGWTWAATTLVSAAAISAFVVISARVMTIGLSYLVVFSVTLALLVLNRIVREVAPQPLADSPMALREDDWQRSTSVPDGAAAAAARWDTRLSWTQSDPERFGRTVAPILAELVDERLRQRHGLTRAADPERARELLGDPLWTFLATPVTRSLTPRELAALVAHMEAL